MGAFVTIIRMGMMIGPVAGGLVYDVPGLPAVFYTNAAISSAVIVPVIVVLGSWRVL